MAKTSKKNGKTDKAAPPNGAEAKNEATGTGNGQAAPPNGAEADGSTGAEGKSQTTGSPNGQAAPLEAAAPAENAYTINDAAEFGRNMARLAVKGRELMSTFLMSQAE